VIPDPAAEYERAMRHGDLRLPPLPVAWHQGSRNWTASILLDGAPEEATPRLVIRASAADWPAGNLSLIWRDVRVRGFDLAGPPHANLRGRMIPTPHQQWYDASGRQEVGGVDLAAEEIDGLESAARWFVKWCEIQGTLHWRQPPLQSRLPDLPAQLPRKQRRRS